MKIDLPQLINRRYIKYLLISIFILASADVIFLLSFTPTIRSLSVGTVPESTFIARYKEKRKSDVNLPDLKWSPTVKKLPKSIKMPFIVAEDSRFYSHSGIDFEAIWSAFHYNLRRKKLVVGASTISQQTAKNLFLSPHRNLIRKWHEMILTLLMEAMLSKEDILATYLNIAEFGTGIYGIQAASQEYFGKSANQLTLKESVALAATLPSPQKNNPRTQTKFFTNRTQKIMTTIKQYYSYLAPTSLESINESEINDPELSEQINIPPEPHAVTNHSLSQPVPLPPENQLDIEIPNLQPANGEKP